MRGAIHIPCFDCEQDSPLGTGLIAFIEEPLDEGGIIFDHAGATPKLDPLPPRGIEQEQKCTVIFAKIRKSNVLSVAPVVDKAKRPVIDDFNKALRPASVATAFPRRNVTPVDSKAKRESSRMGQRAGFPLPRE